MLTKTRDKARRRKGISSYTDKPLTPEEQRLYDEIDRRFSFRYPDEELLTARAKYSVSAIRQEELKAAEAASGEVNVTQADDEVVHLWRGSEGRRKASAADTGIAYHRIMEFLDFTKALDESGAVDEAYINERAELLRDQGAVTEDVYRSLDLGCIASFFAGELGQRAVRAAREGRLRREKPFTLRTERGGREMLVQGVIDCCFEEDGRMVLVDYKSSFIHPGRDHASEIARIRDEYRVQIELYSEALSKGSGREVAEAYLYLFATGEAVDMVQSH
jgi:ATP-dependent helicase/nuclease subunit A